jgi:copper chaperone CopZ
MAKKYSLLLALVGLVVLAVGGTAQTSSPAVTVITIPDMDCPGCAKNVVARLSEVKGVATVKTDVKTRIATVTPRLQTVLSPRALWEAVEIAGREPTILQGPNGKFTKKPQSLPLTGRLPGRTPRTPASIYPLEEEDTSFGTRGTSSV